MKRGRDITWTLQAIPSPEWVVEQWSGSATIIAVRTEAQSLLWPVRQRWSIENSWHWVRAVPLQ